MFIILLFNSLELRSLVDFYRKHNIYLIFPCDLKIEYGEPHDELWYPSCYVSTVRNLWSQLSKASRGDEQDSIVSALLK